MLRRLDEKFRCPYVDGGRLDSVLFCIPRPFFVLGVDFVNLRYLCPLLDRSTL